MRRYELSEQEWQLIAEFVDTPKNRTGRPRRDNQTLLNGIFWILCSGASWRDMPERYGPWQTVYDRFRKWRDNGSFDKILERLHVELNEEGLIDYDVWMVDATSIRANRAAAGAKKGDVKH